MNSQKVCFEISFEGLKICAIMDMFGLRVPEGDVVTGVR